jgi:hypothetical protein
MAERIVVHPPSSSGTRRVTSQDGQLGLARTRLDVLTVLARAGMRVSLHELDDHPLIEWRGGDSYDWTPRSDA